MNITSNLMLSGYVGEVDWELPDSSKINEVKQVSSIMPLLQIEEKLGFYIPKPNMAGLSMLGTAYIVECSYYYGDFSAGCLIGYKLEQDSKYFSVIVQKMVNYYEPKKFLFPKKSGIRVYQKEINSGEATIVLVPDILEKLASYAIFVINDIWVDFTFYWKPDETTVESLISSIPISKE